jgi:non-heme chloroperoxidase
MPFFETRDHTRLFFTDWDKGNTGKSIVFVSSWALGGAMWEYQTVPLSHQGLRCITFDRRSHGRSDDPGHGYDFDTLADDLAALLEHLDLRDTTLVGHSMGCAEIVRYVSRHGTDRIARVALISPITPFILNTADNPEGTPKLVLDAMVASLMRDRPSFFTNGTIKFFGQGSKWPGPPVISNEIVQWALHLILQSSPHAVTETLDAFFQTDFRPDMPAVNVPTLIIHGDRDQNASIETCGRRTAQAISGSQFKVYEGAAHGLFITDKDRLNSDLLAFIQG